MHSLEAEPVLLTLPGPEIHLLDQTQRQEIRQVVTTRSSAGKLGK